MQQFIVPRAGQGVPFQGVEVRGGRYVERTEPDLLQAVAGFSGTDTGAPAGSAPVPVAGLMRLMP